MIIKIIIYLEFKFVFSFLIAYRGDIKTLLDAFKRGVPTDITDKFMKTPLMVGKLSKSTKCLFFS